VSLKLLPKMSLGARLDMFERLARELFGEDAVTVSASTQPTYQGEGHEKPESIEIRVEIDIAKEFPRLINDWAQEGLSRGATSSSERTPRPISSTGQRDPAIEGEPMEGSPTTSSSGAGGQPQAVDLDRIEEPPLNSMPRAAEGISQHGAHEAMRGKGAALNADDEARQGVAPALLSRPESALFRCVREIEDAYTRHEPGVAIKATPNWPIASIIGKHFPYDPDTFFKPEAIRLQVREIGSAMEAVNPTKAYDWTRAEIEAVTEKVNDTITYLCRKARVQGATVKLPPVRDNHTYRANPEAASSWNQCLDQVRRALMEAGVDFEGAL
jgi:hypothetical protein